LRNTRIFRGLFDFLPLGGTKEGPDPYPENRIARIGLGRVGDAGPWGRRFERFMQTRTAADRYAAHGLCHAQRQTAGS
jgi:hypothetical protein